MAEKIEKITVSTTKRNAPLNGPTSSQDWNSLNGEVTRDLAEVMEQWNNRLVSLIGDLPDGSNDLDAYTNGLDGTNFLVHSEAQDDSATGRYYNQNKSRPNTIKEQFDDVYKKITQVKEDLEAQIESV